MKKIIFIAIIVIIILFIVYQGVLKEKTPEYTLAEVKSGNITQEVSETGRVQKGEEIKLGFKNAGTIEIIYVKVGDTVESGQALAELNATQLIIELDEAKAKLEIAQAELQKLLAGSTPEEIQLAETTLKNAKQNLLDVETSAVEDLKQAYEDAKAILDGSYEKGYSALTTLKTIQNTYFTGNDQESLTVKDKKNNIEQALSEARAYIDAAKAEPTNEKIDSALSKLKSALEDIYTDLTVIRNLTEATNYKNVVSSTDKTSLDTAKTNVNTGLTNVINAQQAIISTKLTNESDINTARGTVEKAEDELAFKKAGPQPAEVDLYQAKVRQAQAQVRLLENQIWETTLRSPTRGQITKVNKKTGEMAQPALAESVLTLLPANPFEIKADIYEEDVIKMEIGNLVDITLIALPNQIFEGKVIEIDPAEKLIEGVVYYQATIEFEEYPADIKPGMTADINIKTASRENVIIIPEEAISKKEGKNIVQVLKDKNQIEEREIKIGLEGSNDMIEVIEGLNEGERVIIQ